MRSFLTVLCLATILPSLSFAQGKPQFAVVDMGYVVKESIAGKAIRDHFKEVNKNRTGVFKKADEEIKARQEALKAEQPKIDPADDAKKKELIAKFRETEIQSRQLRANYEQYVRAIQTDNRNAMGQLQARAAAVIAKLREEYGLLVVMDTRFLVAFQPDIDITQDALERLNKAVPTVNFSSIKPGDKKEQPAKQ